MEKINVITTEKNWLEQKAIDQLKQISLMEGVKRVVGLPDLHPGKVPVGAVVVTQELIYPHLIDNDIGCGMSLFSTHLSTKKFNLDHTAKRLESIRHLSDIDITDTLLPLYSRQDIGTIGGGNHFAEFQMVESVIDSFSFEKAGFRRDIVTMLVHSGSRSLGQSILDRYIKMYQAQHGLKEGTEAFKQYWSEHNQAVDWGKMNRRQIANRLMSVLGIDSKLNNLIESTHNAIGIKEEDGKRIYIHRKGAAPAEHGLVIIPGSRGSLTYLLQPTEDAVETGYSLAHGAGRKWGRSLCKTRLESKYTKESIKYTKFKGRVICHDTQLLFEEAPETYKSIDIVVQALIEAGLAKVVATFKPIITFKN